MPHVHIDPTTSGGAITFRAFVEAPKITEQSITDPILMKLLEDHLRVWYEMRDCAPIQIKHVIQLIGHPTIKFKVGVNYTYGSRGPHFAKYHQNTILKTGIIDR